MFSMYEKNRKIKTCKGECHEKQNRKTIDGAVALKAPAAAEARFWIWE